jgi:hypothetical protein
MPRRCLTNAEEGTKPATPRTETASNDVNNTPREFDSTQYVQHKNKQYRSYSK